MNLSELKRKIDQANGSRETLKLQYEKLELKSKALSKLQQSTDLAVALLQKVAKETQDGLCYHIQDIVQLAIDACFPNEYQFRVEFELKRGRTEARMFLLKNGCEIDPMEASGGGLVDILSFALRISSWSLSRTEKVIILDEPFKHLSRNLQPFAMEILKQLSLKLKLQIIMVTHSKDIIEIADKVFEVGIKKDGDWDVSYILSGV